MPNTSIIAKPGAIPTLDLFDPGDTDNVAMDYTNEMAAGEAVDTCTASITQAMGGDNADITLSSVSVAADVCTVLVSGGTAGATYMLTFTAVTDASSPRTLQRSVKLPFRNI